MKKFIYTVAVLAPFSTACQMEMTDNCETVSGEEFRLQAAITATRTSLSYEDGAYKVEWDGDDILGIVAEYADDTYRSYQFANEEGNTFVCDNVSGPENIMAMYAVYPYEDGLTMGKDGYFSVACGFGTEAVQTGPDNTGHIDAPLYGTGDAGGVTMTHASTLFDVVLTNSTGSDMTISGITLSNSAGVEMTGDFLINPSDGSLKAGADAVQSASLEVEDCVLASGDEAHFYLTSVPFGLEAGQSVTVSVLTSDGVKYEVVKSVDAAVMFEAGKVNHVYASLTAEENVPARIFVDFGLWKDGRVSESPWNNLTSFEYHSLKDETGKESGVSIDLTDWTGANKFEEYYTSGFKTVDDLVFNGIVIPESAFMDWLLSDKKDKASFVINGLDPAVTYEFTTVSIRWNSSSNIREMSIDMQGDGEPQNSGAINQGLKCGTGEYETPDDWTNIGWDKYCKVFTLRPAADGAVTVTLNATPVVTTSTNQQAHLNALVITPVSE